LFAALWETNNLEALLDAGATVDAPETTSVYNDYHKRTPLGFAATQNKADAVEILLKHGANPNTGYESGVTPLHWAALYQPADEKVIRLLLDHNADPNVRDIAGKTPLDLLKEKLTHEHTPDQRNLVNKLIDLLHQHGALDNLPDWDRIEVIGHPGQAPATVFRQGTNAWNRFTLLETILNYYVADFPAKRGNTIPFPDLTRVVIERPSRGSTNATRITVNLLNSSEGVDCSKDVPLEFGDTVRITERDHPLGAFPAHLTDGQASSIINFLHGSVRLFVRDQRAELPLDPYAEKSYIGAVLRQTAAQQLILTSSDLSRVKVSHNDPKTGEKHEWILDCSNPSSPPDLWLRNGDAIEVPEKP
jgi:hypothetical protein